LLTKIEDTARKLMRDKHLAEEKAAAGKGPKPKIPLGTEEIDDLIHLDIEGLGYYFAGTTPDKRIPPPPMCRSRGDGQLRD
jgi:hypothetical protein